MSGSVQRENGVAMVATTSATLIEAGGALKPAMGRVTAAIELRGVNQQIAATRMRMDELQLQHQQFAFTDHHLGTARATPTVSLVPNGATAQLQDLQGRRTQLQSRLSAQVQRGTLSPLAVGISIGGVFLHGWAAAANDERGNTTAAWANGMAATGHGMVVVGKVAEAMSATSGGALASSRFGRAGMALAMVAGVAAVVAARD